jgi:hypothetical protein
MAFRIYQINTGFFLDPEFKTVAETKVHAVSIKSDLLVYDGSTVIGSITGPNKTWICFHSEYHYVE